MKADIVLGWSFAGVPSQAQAAFKRPTKFVSIPTPANRAYKSQVEGLGWPHAIVGALKKYAPGVEPLRVALLGFSESCHGVRNLLNSGDGARVDSVVAIDGIHTPYTGAKQVDPNTMIPWAAFGRLAVKGERLMVVTHSQVVPPNYASTTETADYLWRELAGGTGAFTIPAVPPLDAEPTTIKTGGNAATGPVRSVSYPYAPWLPWKRDNGLVILGCENQDVPRGTADHIYQAKVVLPLVVVELLADRWNSIAPGSCTIA